jgi:hypothetical protein
MSEIVRPGEDLALFDAVRRCRRRNASPEMLAVARRASRATFGPSDVVARRIPAHDGGAKTEGVLYILEFSDGLIKVGRSTKPLQRVETHIGTLRKYAQSELVRGWLSPFHADHVETEAALIECGHRLATSVRGNEFLVGACFADLVSFAGTLLYLPTAHGPRRRGGMDGFIEAHQRGLERLRAAPGNEFSDGSPLPAPTVVLPPPSSEDGEELLQALTLLAEASGNPPEHAYNMTHIELLALRNQQEVDALAAKRRSELAAFESRAYADGRTDLTGPMLSREKYPEIWERIFEPEPEETEADRAAMVAWVEGMRERYLAEVALNQHDDQCEFTATFWLCECPRRRREASGFTELPGALIWQVPTCPRCHASVRDEAGVGWMCVTCNVEWSRDGDQSLFLDVLGDDDEWLYECCNDSRTYADPRSNGEAQT